MKGWTARIDEIGTHTATELRWPEVWALIARGQHVHDLAWVQRMLWRLRVASWVLTLDTDPLTCRTCGGHIEPGKRQATYCDTACRKTAFRCRQNEIPTVFEAEVNRARATMAEIKHEVEISTRALRRWLNRSKPFLVLPPDWNRLDHVPNLPPRCSRPCDANPCRHTGGICLYHREEEDHG